MKFETWKFKGKKFLAVPTGMSCNVAIMDSDGNGYGAWYSVADFRERQRDMRECSAIGRVTARIVT